MLRKLILNIIGFYKKYLSPFLPHACRYTPTCSEYMSEAIIRYGIPKGTYLGIKRLLRCHPWGGEGYDPVVKDKASFTDNKDTN